MNPNMLYDFIQVLKINRKHPTKDYYFRMHILIFYSLFTTGL
jgi:hypothetical protein